MINELDQMRVGNVLRIEHASIYDGDGIRTVVFLKGCPLSCCWCSTPESQEFSFEHYGGTTYGRFMTVEEVFREIQKDEQFFFHSGGGVTFSGGESLMQTDFVYQVLLRCRRVGIGTAIETSLYADFSFIQRLLPQLDMIYADLKILDGSRHRALTGVDNALILDNIRRVDQVLDHSRLILRTPIIPGVNDGDDDMRAAAEFCAGLEHLSCWELLPYHRLGMSTYQKMGREYLLPNLVTPDRAYMEQKAAVVRAAAPKLKLSLR